MRDPGRRRVMATRPGGLKKFPSDVVRMDVLDPRWPAMRKLVAALMEGPFDVERIEPSHAHRPPWEQDRYLVEVSTGSGHRTRYYATELSWRILEYMTPERAAETVEEQVLRGSQKERAKSY